jgi:TolA-binding protein
LAPPPTPREESARPTPATAATRAVEAETAAALFARANRARQSGDARGAIDLYRQLTRRFPQSEEAGVAHVSLGRLLLDRQGDASGALVELDRYLADPRHVALRESCLIGRARALGMLGQRDDERRAWEALLAEYPDSLHVGRARARLGELR